MIVVDASVMITVLADDTDEGVRIRGRLVGEDLAAPELLDLEVLSAIRRLERAGGLSRDRAAQAVESLAGLPLTRAPHRPLLPRCWELRHHVSPYDASYVALAELLTTTLVTADARLAGARGPRCPIELTP